MPHFSGVHSVEPSSPLTESIHASWIAIWNAQNKYSVHKINNQVGEASQNVRAALVSFYWLGAPHFRISSNVAELGSRPVMHGHDSGN
jgi:hypothetical protein